MLDADEEGEVMLISMLTFAHRQFGPQTESSSCDRGPEETRSWEEISLTTSHNTSDQKHQYASPAILKKLARAYIVEVFHNLLDVLD